MLQSCKLLPLPKCQRSTMSTSRKRASKAIKAFSEDIKSFSQHLNDSLGLLKRTVDSNISAGSHEFKDALSELEEQVSELELELAQLDLHTSQSISLEELLGHCHGLYQCNRQGIVHLEAHLKQYGYQPRGPLQQPKEPLAGLDDDSAAGVMDVQPEHDTGNDVAMDDCVTGNLRKRAGARKAGCVAPTTPHYVMSKEAKAKLKQRVKTPGLPLRQLMDDSDDDDDIDQDDIATNAKEKALVDNVPSSRQQPVHASSRATSSLNYDQHRKGGEKGGAMSNGGGIKPYQQPSWGDSEEDEDTNMVLQAGRGYQAGIPSTNATAAPSLATYKSNANPAVNTLANHGMSTANKPGSKLPAFSPESDLSLSPDGLLLSPSMMALQAKYLTGMDESGMPAAGDKHASQSTATVPAATASVAAKQVRSHVPTSGVPAASSRPVVPSLNLQPAAMQSYNAVAEHSNSRPMDEDATCVLYQQLIRSKDTPGSLMDAAANRQAASARQPASTRGVGAPAHSPRQTSQNSSQMNNVPIKQPASNYVVPPLPKMADDNMPRSSAASPSPRRSRSRGVGSDADDKARADAAQALEARMNSLEMEWVKSGQAALTPRSKRAQAAVWKAQQAVVVPKPCGTGNAATFEFAVADDANSASSPTLLTKSGSFGASTRGAEPSRSKPSIVPSQTAAHKAPSSATNSSIATPALDTELQARYNSSTSAMSSGRSMSPGTAALLSQVYGKNAPSALANHGSTQPVGSSVMLQGTIASREASFSKTAVNVTLPVQASAQQRPATGNEAGLCPVKESEYIQLLPMYLRSQMPLPTLNSHISAMGTLAHDGSSVFALKDIEQSLGLAETTAKLFVNCMVKLNRAVMLGKGQVRLSQ